MADGGSSLFDSIKEFLPVVAGGAIGALAGGGPGALVGAGGTAEAEARQATAGAAQQEKMLSALSAIQSRQAAQQLKELQLKQGQQKIDIEQQNAALHAKAVQATIDKNAAAAKNTQFNQQLALMNYGLKQQTVGLEKEKVGLEAENVSLSRARFGLEELSKGNQYLRPDTFKSWLSSEPKDVQDEGAKLVGDPKAMTMYFESHTNARIQNMKFAQDNDINRLASFTGWDPEKIRPYLASVDGKRRSSTVDAILNGSLEVKSPNDLPLAVTTDAKSDAKARQALEKDLAAGYKAYYKDVGTFDRALGRGRAKGGVGSFMWDSLTPAALAGLNPHQRNTLKTNVISYFNNHSSPDFKFVADNTYPKDVEARREAKGGEPTPSIPEGSRLVRDSSGKPVGYTRDGKTMEALP